FFLYPMERVILWVPIFFLPIIIHVPAIGFLGLWVIIQLYKGTTSVIFEGGAADVAWWAHLGGFIAGGLLYRLFLKKAPPQ
ncbi:MAG: rhomboid family intramembrane serine protease, partial [Methylicorpusculum sp.]|nr:rhomboid family intramembrane serine protease [Methylicorpusculum sp.]